MAGLQRSLRSSFLAVFVLRYLSSAAPSVRSRCARQHRADLDTIARLAHARAG
jgi:hypothetical protein